MLYFVSSSMMMSFRRFPSNLYHLGCTDPIPGPASWCHTRVENAKMLVQIFFILFYTVRHIVDTLSLDIHTAPTCWIHQVACSNYFFVM